MEIFSKFQIYENRDLVVMPTQEHQIKQDYIVNMSVVYFDQLSGAAGTRKLVETILTLVDFEYNMDV